MWTQEAFVEAKRQVFLEHPDTLEIELATAAVCSESFATAETGVPTHDASVEGEYASGESVVGGDTSAEQEEGSA